MPFIGSTPRSKNSNRDKLLAKLRSKSGERLQSLQKIKKALEARAPIGDALSLPKKTKQRSTFPVDIPMRFDSAAKALLRDQFKTKKILRLDFSFDIKVGAEIVGISSDQKRYTIGVFTAQKYKRGEFYLEFTVANEQLQGTIVLPEAPLILRQTRRNQGEYSRMARELKKSPSN